MTTLNNTFERELTQEEKGYESGSESLSIPTPIRRAPWIYHISTSENLSFNPTTPLTTAEQHPETALEDSETAALYTTIWCLVALMTGDL